MPYVTNEGVQLYYETYGEGDRVVVLAHGMGGNSAIWFNQVAALLPDYRVVVFDHRYFARSACSPEEFLPAMFATDALTILDELDIKSAVFVCQSMGGWTGSQIAIQYQNRIDGLVMSHTPGVFTHSTATNTADLKSLTGSVGHRFHSPALAHDFPEKNPAGAALYQMVSAFNGIDNRVITKQIAAANLSVDVASLADYSVPTLFITGAKDVMFPAPYIEALAKAVPGARFRNLGEVGHSSYFESPKAFNQELLEFLSSIVV